MSIRQRTITKTLVVVSDERTVATIAVAIVVRLHTLTITDEGTSGTRLAVIRARARAGLAAGIALGAVIARASTERPVRALYAVALGRWNSDTLRVVILRLGKARAT
jgi:hypothetical protein